MTLMRYLPMAVVLLTAGCAAPDPILAWQHKVEDYVETAGGGDPSIFRLIPTLRSRDDLTPARITISKLGVPGPGLPAFRAERDVSGLLVDTATVDAQRWYVFLVGVLRRNFDVEKSSTMAPIIENIRLSAFRLHGEDFEWLVGPPDSASQALYQARAAPRSDAPAVPSPAVLAPVFPRPDDRFLISNTDAQLQLTEQGTGAGWTLPWPK